MSKKIHRSIRCNLSMFEANLWETWLNSWLNMKLMKHCVFVCRPSDTVPSPSPLHAIGCIVPEIVSQTQPKPGGCMGKTARLGTICWIIRDHSHCCLPAWSSPALRAKDTARAGKSGPTLANRCSKLGLIHQDGHGLFRFSNLETNGYIKFHA